MNTAIADYLGLGAETRRLLSLTQKEGPITKAGLAARCGYQMSSLNRYFDPLLTGGFVAPCGAADSHGGRRPILFDVRENRLSVLGVNISTTFMEIIVVNLKARVLSRERFDMAPETLPDQALATAWDSASRQMADLGLGRDRVIGIGLSIFGSLDRERGVTLPPIVRHVDSAWIGFPIRARLEALSGFPVYADIGTNNIAMAEYLFGNGKEYDRILCVHCAMSIKTSYIASGTMVRTSNNAEEAFSHMSVDVDGLPCVCGNYGCIECYSAVPAMVGRFRGERKKGRATQVEREVGEERYTDILAAADNGDGLAVEVVQHAAAMLGAGLANYINLLNPDLVIMGGMIVRNSALYYRTATEVAMGKSRLVNPNLGTRFIQNNRFGETSTVGAAILAMESILFQGDNLKGG